MGIKLIILLALLVGVLYSLHLLVQDYQALTAASKLLRFLFKRDLSSQMYTKPAVRWKRILLCDPIQCARYFYCELGAQPVNNEVLRGFVYMLTLEPTEQDSYAHSVFKEAYDHGMMYPDRCREKYPMCPFESSLLFQLIRYLVHHPQT
ncbi:uncharacterized protein LOC118265465 isoform X1 [Spodoptera frugiperda]|uniref:Uncharacterized protein LOC118265465 isoform X1 n=1 Tax=Spodoptera frugiperda TaxID=7108 RepID=A0A9R0CZ07_SPOFR|nr:uncharacterized protein LOC118265465 isoform X1 [Spodoptera frugiperda]